MRRHVVTSALALSLAATALTLGPPAGAETPEHAGSSARTAARADGCLVGVLGVDSQRRVRYELFRDGVLDRSQVSAEPLPFDVTAWGVYAASYRTTATPPGAPPAPVAWTLQLNAVTADGTPRNVAIRRNETALTVGRVRSFDQGSFRPRLFADGEGTSYAYAVQGDALVRSTLTRPGGAYKFSRPVQVATGFGDWTSLQVGTLQEAQGRISELLYGTTAQGELMRVVVPVDHPGRARVRRLAATGYAGVTELVFGGCSRMHGAHALVAVSPETGTATYTTIRRPYSKPKAQLRGPLTGVSDWSLTAAF